MYGCAKHSNLRLEAMRSKPPEGATADTDGLYHRPGWERFDQWVRGEKPQTSSASEASESRDAAATAETKARDANATTRARGGRTAPAKTESPRRRHYGVTRRAAWRRWKRRRTQPQFFRTRGAGVGKSDETIGSIGSTRDARCDANAQTRPEGRAGGGRWRVANDDSSDSNQLDADRRVYFEEDSENPPTVYLSGVFIVYRR